MINKNIYFSLWTGRTDCLEVLMDLQKLQRFCAIARSQNMSQAARELFLSEPALSRTLKQIEEELGVSLFTRRGKG